MHCSCMCVLCDTDRVQYAASQTRAGVEHRNSHVLLDGTLLGWMLKYYTIHDVLSVVLF